MLKRFLWVMAPAFLLAGARGLQASSDSWQPFQFLLGTWVGEGSGQPGKGSGEFTLAPDLGGKILVRKNHSDIAAAGGRPAATHDDLMIIYPGEKGKSPRAIYFDNEGHVINYTVTSSPGELVFLSEAAASAPRFRLTYKKTGDDTVSIKFEFAPPGKPDAFRPYIEASARRKNP
jgi:hypothetical protein